MSIFLSPVKHGRTGNNIFQLIHAHNLSKIGDEIYISNFELNELGLNLNHFLRATDSMTPKITAFSQAEAEQLITQNLNNRTDIIILLDYLTINPQLAWIEREFLRGLFQDKIDQKNVSKRSIIHIRAGDVWKNYKSMTRPIHPDYFPLPLNFYRRTIEASVGPVEIVSESGGPDWYLKSVVDITSPVKLHVSRDLAEDFDDFLNCSQLVLSVSTLSWIASLIGDCETVHYPKLGLFDPERRGDLLFFPPKPAFVYEFEDHTWRGGSRLDKEWLMDSMVNVIAP